MSDQSSAKPDEPTKERPSSQGDRFNVTWESPVLDLSGYAASSRSALFGLEGLGVRLRLIPFQEKIEKQP